jgi:hypothetical protein
MRFYASTRAYAGAEHNGDAWDVFEGPTGLRAAVVDGVGHGVEAARASAIALDVLKATAQLPLVESLKRCHDGLRGTRGACISLLQEQGEHLQFAGVGNVEGRFFAPDRTNHHLVPARGILGMVIPSVRPEQLAVSRQWCALLFTDGISHRGLAEVGPFTDASDPQVYVDQIVARAGRESDDATVLILLAD